MGGFWSSKKEGSKEGETDGRGEKANVHRLQKFVLVYQNRTVSVQDFPSHLQCYFITKRTGSMYFDEDGDLAHEFYQEERAVLQGEVGVARWCMKKISKKIRPQGSVDYEFPRLHVDFPLVLLDANATIVPK